MKANNQGMFEYKQYIRVCKEMVRILAQNI